MRQRYSDIATFKKINRSDEWMRKFKNLSFNHYNETKQILTTVVMGNFTLGNIQVKSYGF